MKRYLLRFLRSYLGDETLDYRVRPSSLRTRDVLRRALLHLERGTQGMDNSVGASSATLDADPRRPSLETAVHNGFARVGMPTPVVVLSHDRVEELGRMFMVMELRPGRPSLRVFVGTYLRASFRSYW